MRKKKQKLMMNRLIKPCLKSQEAKLKKLLLVILAVVAVISASSLAIAAKNKPATKVIASYFHGAFRCPTCYKFEQYSKEAIPAHFKEALTWGKIEFKAVNVEDRGNNEHFVNDYDL